MTFIQAINSNKPCRRKSSELMFFGVLEDAGLKGTFGHQIKHWEKLDDRGTLFSQIPHPICIDDVLATDWETIFD